MYLHVQQILGPYQMFVEWKCVCVYLWESDWLIDFSDLLGQSDPF